MTYRHHSRGDRSWRYERRNAAGLGVTDRRDGRIPRWCNGSTTGSGPVDRGSNPCWGAQLAVAQFGSTLRSGRRGREFESLQPDQTEPWSHGPAVRTSPCHGESRGSTPRGTARSGWRVRKANGEWAAAGFHAIEARNSGGYLTRPPHRVEQLLLAQWTRAPDYGSGGCGFESRRGGKC